MKQYIEAACGLAMIANLHAGDKLNKPIIFPGGLKATTNVEENLLRAIAVNKREADVKKVEDGYFITGTITKIGRDSELEKMAKYANSNKDDRVTFKEVMRFTNAFYARVLEKRAEKKE